MTNLTTAPIETIPEIDGMPDVWDMPDQGIEWCECGDSHPLGRDTVEAFARDVVGDSEWITHKEVEFITMDLWAYESVCRFFLMQVEEASVKVHGAVAEKYPFETGIEIVGYFSKTWNGCPDEICSTILDRDYF